MYKKIDQIFQSLRKKTLERYPNLSEEEKNKKRKYDCKRFKNFSEEEKEKKRQCECQSYKNLPGDQKQRIVEYKKMLYNAKK